MKKIVSLIVVSFIIVISYSQDTQFKRPNYKKIEKEIKKKKSDFYYQGLFDRYIQGDSTFTIEEKRYLYYGFSFQDNYSPYGHSEFTDSLGSVLSKDTLTEVDYNSIIKFSNIILEDNPFDLRALNYLGFSYYKIGNRELEDITFYKTSIIYNAIMSTGDGISKKMAFSVIYISHEYEIIDALGFSFGGEQSLVDGGFDYLKLEENEPGVEGFYFEISRSLNSLGSMFK
ncbi:MAG: hypothetical protein DRJ10_19920 [Bacteroidetes bacterium]|nr:MAG: hypothetical protein DRJ10_19920 [Bacteroidota bacterium]